MTSSLVKRKRIRIISANRPRSRPLRSAQYTLLSWNERCCNSGRLCPAVTADELVADNCIKVPATRRCAFAPADSLKENGLQQLSDAVTCQAKQLARQAANSHRWSGCPAETVRYILPSIQGSLLCHVRLYTYYHRSNRRHPSPLQVSLVRPVAVENSKHKPLLLYLPGKLS